jgi:hypothetical protein
MTPTPDYYVAPFSADGELVGVTGRSLAELSPRWLAFCSGMLDARGPAFRCAVPLPPLEHITLKFTSAQGAALLTFLVRGRVATSGVALRGTHPAADAELLASYVDSMRRVRLVQQAAKTATPFEAALALAQRPLYIVVPWADPDIADADMDLVRDLNTHTAAAFLADPRS